jgi:hypothetical protein
MVTSLIGGGLLSGFGIHVLSGGPGALPWKPGPRAHFADRIAVDSRKKGRVFFVQERMIRQSGGARVGRRREGGKIEEAVWQAREFWWLRTRRTFRK